MSAADMDVSPLFNRNEADSRVIGLVLPHEATPEAIKVFARHAEEMTDYGYWFLLSTLWVSHCGHSELNEWKRLFSSPREGRELSIMKPSELRILVDLPGELTVYRAHRENEQDWISYTLLPEKAAEFALRRGVDQISEYKINKDDVLSLFLRRGEFEVLLLDKSKADFVRHIKLVKAPVEEPAVLMEDFFDEEETSGPGLR